MVILVVFKVFLVVKNWDILIQIVPDSPIYYYSLLPQPTFTCSKLTIEALEQRCEICSKLTIKVKTGVLIANFEHISHLVLVFLLITLNM